MMQKIISLLPSRFAWSIHNLISHPLSEIFTLLGLKKASEYIHDCTIPKDEK